LLDGPTAGPRGVADHAFVVVLDGRPELSGQELHEVSLDPGLVRLDNVVLLLVFLRGVEDDDERVGLVDPVAFHLSEVSLLRQRDGLLEVVPVDHGGRSPGVREEGVLVELGVDVDRPVVDDLVYLLGSLCAVGEYVLDRIRVEPEGVGGVERLDLAVGVAGAGAVLGVVVLPLVMLPEPLAFDNGRGRGVTERLERRVIPGCGPRC